ncbi:DUF397 domain-containing protein [Streptomyces sp. NPDC057654]|uniref:DUF397 domain-containing protein n=1 Tax=Streptomyces sp. NPDC057654 TaxID=3346196 RepID=UPI0036A3F01C
MAQAIEWQKSSYSAGGDGANCVELAAVGDMVWIREGEVPGDVLVATPAALCALLRSVKTNEL